MARFSVCQAGEGVWLSVVGERVRILTDSAATGGRCVWFEEITQPGKGPPLHRHAQDEEYFCVVEGRVKFVVDGAEQVIDAGGFVSVPAGAVHAFANVGAVPSRMLIACFPGGIERAFREADRLGREGGLSPEKLAEVFARVGIEFVGPPLG